MAPAKQEKPAPSRAKSRIPRFKTAEEAAAFWDSHDSADFEDEFEDVPDVQFVVTRPGRKKAITVRIDEATVATLAERARQKGIGPSTLVRMWILERLQAEGKRSA